MVRIRLRSFMLCSVLFVNLFFICFVTFKLNYKEFLVKSNNIRSITTTTQLRNTNELLVEQPELLNVLRERAKNMKQTCLDSGKNSEPLNFKGLKNTEWPWIYVSHKYKLLYCQLPKVGTSNWLKIFAWLEHDNTTVDVKNIHEKPLLLLSYLNKAERERVLSSYTKYMVVREPFSRSLSAYKDKFLPHKGQATSVFKALAKRIVTRYRNSTGKNVEEGTKTTDVPTFEEYVKYLVDPDYLEVPTHYSEPRHWEPQCNLCYPCNIDYDFLLKIETVEKESDVLLQFINAPKHIKYPKGNEVVVVKNNKSDKKYSSLNMEYYSKVKPHLVNQLYHYYKNDYDLFDYAPPPQF